VSPVFLFFALGGFLKLLRRGNELAWLLAGLIWVSADRFLRAGSTHGYRWATIRLEAGVLVAQT